MNRTIIKQADRVYAGSGFLRLEWYEPEVSVDIAMPKVVGSGLQVNKNDLRGIAATKAFKRGEIYTEGGKLVFELGKVRVFAELEEPDLEPLERPLVRISDGYEWNSAIMSTRKAASGKVYRSIFRGVQFEPGRVVASDGFRLHAADIATPAGKPTVINAKALDILNGLKPERYSFTPKALIADGEGWAAYIPAMEGEYPDYMRVVPGGTIEPPTCPADENWKELLETAMKTNRNRGDLRVDVLMDGSVKHETVHIEGVFENVPIERSFNAFHLLEALKHTEGGGLHYGLETQNVLVKGGNRWAVIAPLRV